MTDDTPAAGGMDERRERALEAIAERRRSGALSLEELDAAVRRVREAASPGELDAVVTELPPAATGAASRRRWLVSVLGGAQQRGRWMAPRSLRLASLLGGAELDLGRACIAGDDVSITCVAVLGGLTVIAPPGVPVELSGFALLGGRSDERRRAEPLPGAPIVHLRAIAILGGASVREPRAGKHGPEGGA